MYVLMFSFSMLLTGVRILKVCMWIGKAKATSETRQLSKHHEGGIGSAFVFLFGQILVEKHGIKL